MKLRLIACFVLLGLIALPAFADQYSVSVGYADGLRGPGFFPIPWDGAAGVTFVGGSPGGSFDAGAIMITNISAAPIIVNDISVNINGFITDISAWDGHVLGVGKSLIVTQTTDFNFDSSDANFGNVDVGCGVNNGVIPVVTATVDTVATSFNDSGQVLNTSGYDFACNGSNESFQWRPIGTFGGPAGQTPEPASLMFLGAGVLGLTRKYWKRSSVA